MSTVEIETGRYVKRWAFWNPATWSIPKLYWDAWSQEQRIHAICRQLEKVIKYADYLGVNVDDIAARLKAIEDGQLDDFIVAAIEAWFEENEPEIAQAIEQLQADVANIVLEIGTGFDAENTVADAIAAETQARIDADETETQARTETDADILKRLSIAEYPDEIPGMEIVGRYQYSNAYGAQAFALYKASGVTFMVCGFTSTSTDIYYLDVYNMATGERVQQTPTRTGHCNQMDVHDGKIYITLAGVVAAQHTDMDVWTINADGTITFDLNVNLASIGFTYLSTFGYYKDDQWFASTGSNFYLINEDLTERTYIGETPRTAVEGGYQSLHYLPDLDLFCYAISFPSKLLFFDIEMNPVKTIQLKPAYNFAMLDELEDVCMFDGAMYFNNNNPRIANTHATDKLMTVWKYDRTLDHFDMWDLTLATGASVYIKIDETNADGLNKVEMPPYNAANALTLKYASDVESFMLLPYELNITFESDTTWGLVLENVHAVVAFGNYKVCGAYVKNATMFCFLANQDFTNTSHYLYSYGNPCLILAYEGGNVVNQDMPNITALANNFYVIMLLRSNALLTTGAAGNASGKIRFINGKVDTTLGTGVYTS